MAGRRRAAVPAGASLRQPAAEGRQVEVVHLLAPAAHEVVEQEDGVGDVAADRVLGQIALAAQVVLVAGESLGEGGRQRSARLRGSLGHAGTVRSGHRRVKPPRRNRDDARRRGMGRRMPVRHASVAAGGSWTDPEDGIRYPSGEVHAWERGRNETVCGLSLSKSRLGRFPHVSWEDVQPESGRHAEEVADV
jgi:hypothetical protein